MCYLIPPLLMLGARQRPFPRTSKATPLYVATPLASVHRSGCKHSQILCLGFSSLSGSPATANTIRYKPTAFMSENEPDVVMSGSYRGNSGKWLCLQAERRWAELRVPFSLDWQHRGGGPATPATERLGPHGRTLHNNTTRQPTSCTHIIMHIK